MHPNTYAAGTSIDRFSLWADLCGSYGVNSSAIADGVTWERLSRAVPTFSPDYAEYLLRKGYDDMLFDWPIKDPFADGPIKNRDDFKAPEMSVESLLE